MALLALVIGAAGSICLVLLLLNTPSAVNGLASVLEPLTGYKIHVDGISLSSNLRGEISNLIITARGEGLPLASFDHVELKANPVRPITALVEKVVLRHPKFRLIVKEDKKETDWAGIDKLPPVQLLQIEQGEIDVSGASYRIRATDLNATVRDFSPRSGGKAHLTSVLVMSKGNRAGWIEGRATVTADIQLKSLSPKAVGKGAFSVSVKSASFSGLVFNDVLLDVPLSLDSEKLVFDRTVMRIGSLDYKTDSGRGTVNNAVFNGSGWFDRRSSLLTLKNIRGNLSDAGEFSGSGSAMLSGDFRWKTSFSARSIDFSRVFALMNPLLPGDYRKWGIQGKGGLDADLAGLWSDEVEFGGTLRLSMREAGFTSADKTKAAAGLTGEVVLKLRSPGSTKGGFTSRIEMHGGEFLWGAYYKDFKGENLSVSSKGEFSFGADASLDCAGDMDLYQTGNYTYRASVREELLSFTATARNISNKRFHTILFKDYLGEDSALSGLEVSGASDVEVSLLRNQGGTVAITGRVRISEASLAAPKSRIVLETLTVDFPFDLLLNGGDAEDGKGIEGKGFIKLKRFQRAGIVFENVEVPLVTSRNRFETLKEIDADLFGGRVRVGAVRAFDVLGASPEVSTRISAEGLDLAKLAQELVGLSVQGSVDADLGEVLLRQGKWTSSGSIRGKGFGGEVEVKNISASNLLAPSRSFSGDVTFGGIDLEQVTNLIETGRVTGFIKGSLTDFTMSYGEPSSFVLVLESDASKSARRMISVDAIKNLSIIGTGSSGISAVLNSGINRFFKAYPYSRIGIMCTLENDTFRLRGTIREGNTEYLIRKALFRGIDVVNQNPDNAISFRDMQERIGRIFKSGEVTTEVS